jgi:hypothetical protein
MTRTLHRPRGRTALGRHGTCNPCCGRAIPRGLPIEIIRTSSDRIQDKALTRRTGILHQGDRGGAGGQADRRGSPLLRTSTEPPGLAIAAVPECEDAHDVWLARREGHPRVPAGSRIGASSLRRRPARSSGPTWSSRTFAQHPRGCRSERRALRRDRLARAGLHRLGLLPGPRSCCHTSWSCPLPGRRCHPGACG